METKTEEIESLSEVLALRPGDQIRVDGRWLELQALRTSQHHAVLVTYDEIDNRIRSFAVDPYAQRRVRQLATVAS